MKRAAPKIFALCLPALLMLVCPELALADDELGVERRGLHWLDWLMLILYATGVIALGYYYSRKQASTSEYFIGSGSMSSVLIGVSLFATLLSTISYLSYPGEMIKHGPVYLAGLLSIPIAFVIVGYVLIPIYMKQRVTSAYELLEHRLGLAGRTLGALMFIVLRLVWMSLLIFLSAEALVVILALDHSMVPVVAAVTGLIAIIYTSLGGLRAVVITDAAQCLLLFGGALLTIGLVTHSLGGVQPWWPHEWASNWDAQPVFSIDPTVRVTVIGMIIAQVVFRVGTAGGDQTQIQRFMATRDAAAARRSYLVNSIVGIVVLITLAIVGFALLGYFQANEHLVPRSGDLVGEADYLFPYYISDFLPPGVSGLVMAAMFAAAMSSVDSGINSITAVVMKDFLPRLRLEPATQKGHVRLAMCMAVAIGVIVVGASSFMQYVPGNFLEVTQRTTNLLVAPLFALFILALFVRSANGLGAVIGGLYGFAAALVIAFWETFTGLTPISFMWIGITALIVNLAVGILVSRAAPITQPRAERAGIALALTAILAIAMAAVILLP